MPPPIPVSSSLPSKLTETPLHQTDPKRHSSQHDLCSSVSPLNGQQQPEELVVGKPDAPSHKFLNKTAESHVSDVKKENLDLKGKGKFNHKAKIATFPIPDSPSSSSLSDSDADSERLTIPSLLPSEVLIQIFSWLNLPSIDAAALVCTKWRRIIQSDSLWREIFNNNFNSVLTFSRLTSSVSWRIEYLERVNALRRWKRDGPNSKGVITFKIPVPVIDTFAVDFTGLRILTYSFRFQKGFAADLVNGRLGFPSIKASRLSDHGDLSSLPVMSKYGVAFAFWDNSLTTVSFSKGTSVREYKRFPDAHNEPVTALWTCQNTSPKTPGKITLVSGDVGGTVKGWDFATGELLFEFSVPYYKGHSNSQSTMNIVNPYGFNDANMPAVPTNTPIASGAETPNEGEFERAAIIRLECDYENLVIVCDHYGRVFRYNRQTNHCGYVGNCRIDDAPYSLRHKDQFAVDFVAGYVLACQSDHILRIKFDTGTQTDPTSTNISNDLTEKEGDCTKLVPLFPNESMSGLSLDESLYTGITTSTTPKLLPGQGSRLVAAYTLSNNVYVWDMREVFSRNFGAKDVHQIKPFLHFENPFGSGTTVTAIALNSLVFAISSDRGRLSIHDALTGKVYRHGTRRISRNIWNMSALPTHSYHIELNPDATKTNGVLVIDNVVQHFSFGGVDGTNNGANGNKKSKNKGIKKRSTNYHGIRRYSGSGVNSPRDMRKLQEMEDDIELAKEIVTQHQQDAAEARLFGGQTVETEFLDDMTEEDQIRYAMLLSEESNTVEPIKPIEPSEELLDINEEDEDFKAAVQLSLLENGDNDSPGSGYFQKEVEYQDTFEDDYYDEDDNDLYEDYWGEPPSELSPNGSSSRKSSSSSTSSSSRSGAWKSYIDDNSNEQRPELEIVGDEEEEEEQEQEEEDSWMVAALKKSKPSNKKGKMSEKSSASMSTNGNGNGSSSKATAKSSWSAIASQGSPSAAAPANSRTQEEDDLELALRLSLQEQ